MFPSCLWKTFRSGCLVEWLEHTEIPRSASQSRLPTPASSHSSQCRSCEAAVMDGSRNGIPYAQLEDLSKWTEESLYLSVSLSLLPEVTNFKNRHREKHKTKTTGDQIQQLDSRLCSTEECVLLSWLWPSLGVHSLCAAQGTTLNLVLIFSEVAFSLHNFTSFPCLPWS